jgi:hypothetical protein
MTQVEETKLRKVTIDYSDSPIGKQEFEAEVLTHLHDVDGSQIILLKTPRRNSVEQFLHDELTAKSEPKQMAKWFHEAYEEIAKEIGWETQDNCKTEFDELPEKNKETMIKVCERWLNAR